MNNPQLNDHNLIWAKPYMQASANEIIERVVEHFGTTRVALATSFGAEDQVLTHILRTHFPNIPIFTIDTGRLPQETYDLMQKTMERYKFNYEVLFPDKEQVMSLIGQYGPNLFYENIDLRKKCCQIRKVVPLQSKLSRLAAWICGLRQGQSVTRQEIAAFEWDENNGLVKVNPLASWSEQEVWDYIKQNNVPYNILHDRGYPSIGCAPCTRAISNGENIRAGRWWWEDPIHKECGLHNRSRINKEK